MPYLTKFLKTKADENPVFGRGDPSILSYRLTKTIIDWLGKDPSYAEYAAAIGTLETTKLELYRRSLGPQEEHSIIRNGDIYPYWLLPDTKDLIDNIKGIESTD